MNLDDVLTPDDPIIVTYLSPGAQNKYNTLYKKLGYGFSLAYFDERAMSSYNDFAKRSSRLGFKIFDLHDQHIQKATDRMVDLGVLFSSKTKPRGTTSESLVIKRIFQLFESNFNDKTFVLPEKIKEQLIWLYDSNEIDTLFISYGFFSEVLINVQTKTPEMATIARLQK